MNRSIRLRINGAAIGRLLLFNIDAMAMRFELFRGRGKLHNVSLQHSRHT